MHIVVCVKQIFDPEVATSIFKVDEEKKSVVSIPGLQLVMSPFDEQAVEAALRIREQSPDEVKISLLTLGAPSARDVLKHGLSMGADEGFFVERADPQNEDSYTTAFVLSKAIQRLGDVALILCGRQAADRDAGIVACGIAALLDFPMVNWAKSLELKGEVAVVDRVLDDGTELVEVDLPAVVSISNELGDPRKPSLRETMRAARKSVTSWPLSEFEITDGGESLSKQSLQRLYVPVKESNCQIIEGASAQELAKNLIYELKRSKVLDSIPAV